MIPEKKRVLITVKAYPNLSKKYRETVCCAGIDLSNNQWIRLYPIPFRELDDDKKFKKYSVIEVTCNKAKDDHRPESFKVDIDSIRIIDYLDTKKDKWKRRCDIVLPTLSPSFCHILNNSKSSKKSLGAFRPTLVDFVYKKTSHRGKEEQEAPFAQLSFYNKVKNVAEPIPYDFHYIFKCQGQPDCQGHKLSIVDWELGQSYRSWRWDYPDENILLEKIKQKWLGLICSEKRDVSFFVGNLKRFPDTFMVLGTFYPPKVN